MDKRTKQQLLEEIEAVRIRAEEAEETLRAIRACEVDALLLSGPEGERIFSLEGAERTYRAFVEEMSDGAVTLSGNGTIFYSNQRFAEIVKTPLERVVGTTLFMWSSKDDQDLCMRLFERGKEARQSGEFVLCTSDGALVPVRVSISPLKLSGSVIASAVITDISEIRQYMQELERSNKELQNFTFISSHDLQEPLRKIQTFADMLVSKCAGTITDDGRDYLRRMCETAARMKQVIQSLLRYSRLSFVDEPLERVDLNKIVRDIASDLEFEIRDSGASVECEKLPDIEAHTDQMRQLFQNLLGNALKFRKEGKRPRVRIHAQRHKLPESRWEISVDDNGIGFDEKYRVKIFQPFQRLHGRDKYPGTGIGLAICKKIVERQGGTITARSTPGKGSTFIITLPALSQSSKEKDNLVSGLKKVPILIAEDDPDDRFVLGEALKVFKDLVDPYFVEDGVKLMEYLYHMEKEPALPRPELIMLDLQMPREDGRQALIEIKLNEKLRTIPVVIWTNSSMEEERRSCISAGAEAYVTKPDNFADLNAAVRDIIERRLRLPSKAEIV